MHVSGVVEVDARTAGFWSLPASCVSVRRGLEECIHACSPMCGQRLLLVFVGT